MTVFIGGGGWDGQREREESVLHKPSCGKTVEWGDRETGREKKGDR